MRGQRPSNAASSQAAGIFQPWLKKCPGWRKVCCKEPIKSKLNGRALGTAATTTTTLCPGEYTGLRPVPNDCTKFANCWKGAAVIQSCGPGTHFNAIHSVCDWPSKARCSTTSVTSSSSMVSTTATVSQEPNEDSLDDDFEDDWNEIWDLSLNGYARSGRQNLGQIVYPSPPSGQKVRLRGGKAPFSGYLEIFYSNQWGFVCDAGSWTHQEADLVCKQLGFSRGVRSTTQGLVHGPVDSDRKMTEKVECQGFERHLQECRIKYRTRAERCKAEESIVSVTCVHDSFALCSDNEVPWGDSCYSVHFNRSTFDEASQTCQREGKQLVELTDQAENDLLSELLIHSQYSSGLLRSVFNR